MEIICNYHQKMKEQDTIFIRFLRNNIRRVHRSYFLVKIIRKKLVISSICIKKFTQDTYFMEKSILKTDFKAPVSLAEGLQRTIDYEFVKKVQGHTFSCEQCFWEKVSILKISCHFNKYIVNLKQVIQQEFLCRQFQCFMVL